MTANTRNRVTTRCPSCAKTFQVPSGVLGKRTRCTQCGNRFELEEVNDDSEYGDAYSPTPPPAISFDGQYEETDVEEAIAPPVQTRSRRSSVRAQPSRVQDVGGFRFLPLRFICLIVEVIVAISAIVGILGLVWQLIEIAMQEGTTFEDVRGAFALTFVQFVLGTVVLAVALLLPQLIRLLLKIEENTSASVAEQQNTNAELAGLIGLLEHVDPRGQAADRSY